MPSDIFIGNTDHDWFEFCKTRPGLDYVNFWRPSKQAFKALEVGGLFFFRRKSPINLIGGFGEFVATGQISIEDAWGNIGISNGLESLEDFVSRVAKYRRSDLVTQKDLVTFNLLKNPVFLDEKDWFELPNDWSPNIVTGKSYDSSTALGYELLSKARQFKHFEASVDQNLAGFTGFSDNPKSGYIHKNDVRTRIGQGAFSMAVRGAYENRCAVTGTTVHSALEAAHIEKYSETQNNHVTNGILLRRDIHALYDDELIRFTSDYKVKTTERLKQLYSNATEYLSLDGKPLTLPKSKALQPIIPTSL